MPPIKTSKTTSHTLISFAPTSNASRSATSHSKLRMNSEPISILNIDNEKKLLTLMCCLVLNMKRKISKEEGSTRSHRRWKSKTQKELTSVFTSQKSTIWYTRKRKTWLKLLKVILITTISRNTTMEVAIRKKKRRSQRTMMIIRLWLRTSTSRPLKASSLMNKDCHWFWYS